MSRTRQGLLGLLSLSLAAAGVTAATSTSADAAPFNGPLVQITEVVPGTGGITLGSDAVSYQSAPVKIKVTSKKKRK